MGSNYNSTFLSIVVLYYLWMQIKCLCELLQQELLQVVPFGCAKSGCGQSEKNSMDEKNKPESSKSHPDQCPVRIVKYYSFYRFSFLISILYIV